MLLNGDEFEKYKVNPFNQEVYSYTVELMTKIPVLPLKVVSVNFFKPLDSFFNDELKKIKKNKNQDPLKVEAIETLLSSNVDFDKDFDKSLSTWLECIGKMEED